MSRSPAAKVKSELQLEFMRTHFPKLGGPTVDVIAKRRRALIKILANIHVNDNGCMIYGSPDVPHRPRVHWAETPQWSEFKDRRGVGQRGGEGHCKWPGAECLNPRLPRVVANGKHPHFCGEAVDGVVHNYEQARQLRARSERERHHPGSKDVHIARVLLDVYHPGHGVKMVSSHCRVIRCVHPGHRMDDAARIRPGVERKWSTEQVREVVRLRCMFTEVEDIVKLFPGMSVQFVHNLYKGYYRAAETADIRANKPPSLREKFPREFVRAILEHKIATGLNNNQLAAKFSVSVGTVTKMVRGKTYSHFTEDLREQLCQQITD